MEGSLLYRALDPILLRGRQVDVLCRFSGVEVSAEVIQVTVSRRSRGVFARMQTKALLLL